MIITLGLAREAVADYVGKKGKCPTSEETRLFIHEVLERLLHRGTYGNIKKFCFWTCNQCFTAPPDLETIIKVKINGYPDFAFSKWFSFYDTPSNIDFEGCESGTGVNEEANEVYTAYSIPPEGAYIGVVASKEEDPSAHIIIQGKDLHGRDIFVKHKSTDIHGELLTISHDKPVRTKTIFSTITGVTKSRTNSHIQLKSICPSTGKQTFLAEYKPTETTPSYRRYRVPGVSSDCCAQITVLGRIKLLDFYHDNDILPITSLSALKKMAEMIQAESNDSIQTAAFKSRIVDRLIEDENMYKKVEDATIDVVYEISPGSLKGL